MNNTIHDAILHTVLQNRMLTCSDKVVVGVSGGADSMCLLHFLMSVREKFQLDLIVAHINHHLRGEEADRDQKTVEEFCRQFDVRCEVLNADIPRLCAESGESCEECGRRIRYEFFRKLSTERGKIATAHTLSDTAETVIFHIARGTGLKGLTGIPKVRENIIRPLSDISRMQVEEYCQEYHIPYVQDSTNFQNEYNRNKIRNIITPVMKQINPSFENAVRRLSMIAEDYLSLSDELAQQVITQAEIPHKSTVLYRCDVLQRSHRTVRRQALMLLFQKNGCRNYEEKHIHLTEQILLQSEGIVELPDNFIFAVKQGTVRVYRKSPKETIQILFPKNNAEFILNQQKITIEIIAKEEFDKNIRVNKLLLKNALDCDIIHSETLIRNRLSGDRFRQQNRGVTKSVKNLFIQTKIPAEERDSILLIANGNDVLWIDGFGVSEKACVTAETRQAAVIRTENLQ